MGAASEFDDATTGRDTDFEDTFRYEHPDGPAEPARGKRWLGGRCSLSCGDRECPPCQRQEQAEADRLPPKSFPWLNGAPDVPDDVAAARAQQERDASLWGQWYERTPPTDEQVQHLEQATDRALAKRDRLYEVWHRTGFEEDEQSMLQRERHAYRLLTQYNAAVSAQWAEVKQRRDVNIVRHERDQAAARGDLAATLQCDDWLEDHDTDRRRAAVQPPTKQSTTDRHSGATMSSAVSYDSLKARLIGIDYAGTQGMLQQALQGIEQLNAELAGVAEGGGAGVQEALGLLQQAQQSAEEANQALSAAQQSTESAAAQLSS